MSPQDIEDLKGNIMTETPYLYEYDDVTYNFIAKKNQIDLLILTESFKINLFLDMKTFLQQLVKIAERYEETDDESSDSSDDGTDDDPNDDSEDYEESEEDN
jgi:hypothetical protein